MNAAVNDGEEEPHFAATDIGISVPTNQGLSLPVLLSFLKSECPPSLLELLKNDASILLECSCCRNIFRDLSNFFTHRLQFCPAETSRRRFITPLLSDLQSVASSEMTDLPVIETANPSELELFTEENNDTGVPEHERLASGNSSSSVANTDRSQMSRLDRIVSQLQQRTALNGSVKTSPDSRDFLEDVGDTSISTRTQLSLSNSSRHKPYNQTTENFSAVISISQSKCLVCRKTFSARKNLIHHARMFHRELLSNNGLKPFSKFHFKCKICGHQFQWKSSLWRHKKEKHSSFSGGIGDVIADDSPSAVGTLSTPNSQEVVGENEIHLDEKPKTAYLEPLKPFKCDFCDVRFTGHKARRKHVKSKHPDCDPLRKQDPPSPATGVLLDLSSREYDEMMLQSSQSSANSPPGVYPCTDCGVQFRIKSSMMSHRARKHGKRDLMTPGGKMEPSENKEFECNICGAAFNLMLSLKVHITKKHGRQKEVPNGASAHHAAPSQTHFSHNYETKSAIRARNEQIVSSQVDSNSASGDQETFVVQQNVRDVTHDSDLESKTSESESYHSEKHSVSWVNPRLAEYEKVSDLETLTCKVCWSSFEDRKKLFLHLNRSHLNSKNADSDSLMCSNDAGDDGEQSASENVNSESDGLDRSSRSCRKVRSYSKICNFQTLSCKLCPRQCNSMSQLQNHALYKHMNMVELVPMKNEGQLSTGDEAEMLDLTMDSSGGNEDDAAINVHDYNVRPTSRSSERRGGYDAVNLTDENQNAEKNGVLNSHGFVSPGKKNSIYLFEDYVIVKSHTCLLCNKSFTTSSNLLRHMTAVHKNMLDRSNNAGEMMEGNLDQLKV